MNTITIAGRIGQDATTRQFGDSSVTSFSVADEQKVKGEKTTTWWNCAIWGARGTALEQYLTKGSTVCVSGTASFRQYEKSGETRVSAECKVTEIALLGGRPEGDTGRREAPQRQAHTNDFTDDDLPPF